MLIRNISYHFRMFGLSHSLISSIELSLWIAKYVTLKNQPTHHCSCHCSGEMCNLFAKFNCITELLLKETSEMYVWLEILMPFVSQNTTEMNKHTNYESHFECKQKPWLKMTNIAFRQWCRNIQTQTHKMLRRTI